MNEITPEIIAQIEALSKKYGQTGQSLTNNLEGLLHADYLKYWDYIHVDTLLTLQKPRTHFADELIFIGYHQITEIYFKLILSEIHQIAQQNPIQPEFLLERMQRIHRYFELLVSSFDIVVAGMDKTQFRQFRMALLPSSGFQSAQFRKIEIVSTDFKNLVSQDFRDTFGKNATISGMYEHIYWKNGATEVGTGKKTITLEHFEEKYSDELMQLAYEYKQMNLWEKFKEIDEQNIHYQDIREAFRRYDYLVNIEWTLAHFRAATKHLKTDTETTQATGGTNWTKYLPPRFQKRIFYPQLWTSEEIEYWGRF
jgi:tryptophan 2,3-dioxygenase